MTDLADIIAIGARALSFIAALHAAGMLLFLWLFGEELQRSKQVIRALAARMTYAALVIAVAHQLIEPARLAGTLSGALDSSLQVLLLNSDAGTTAAIRILGLVLIALSLSAPNRLRAATGLIGATLVIVSFAFMGHTAAADERWLLATLLIVHLIVVAFWFGALLPLYIVSRTENHRLSGLVIERFSSNASKLVPVILIAGIAMAAVLLPSISSLTTAYGVLLITKFGAFSLLMALASINKWRLGPLVASGDPKASAAFGYSVLIEWALIAITVAVTAVMTGKFSPTH